jgi:5-methylcytosine-specific restriction endonuclease McrA
MKTQARQNYAAERLDPRWQKKRLEIMQRDAFKCTDCCDEKSTLNVHHRYYVKNREVWDYPNFALVTLCAECHSTAHVKRADDEESAISAWEDGLDTLTAADPEWINHISDLAYTMAVKGVSLRDLVNEFFKNHQ